MFLAGDRPRGTLYAVYTFLEDMVGCRWWSAKVSTHSTSAGPDRAEQHVRYVPPLEYREPFWMDAFDGDWAARNKSNGNSERLERPARRQGALRRSFFVHTFAAARAAGEVLPGTPGVVQRGQRASGWMATPSSA